MEILWLLSGTERKILNGNKVTCQLCQNKLGYLATYFTIWKKSLQYVMTYRDIYSYREYGNHDMYITSTSRISLLLH